MNTKTVLLFVGVVIILGAVWVGFSKNKQVSSPVIPQEQDVVVEKDDVVQPKKPAVLSFEAKARLAAQKGECSKYGTIGVALRVEEQYEYALFTINKGSESAGSCAVDMYQRTTVEAIIPTCKTGDINCHGTGALPSPRKQYEQIPVAPDPSTLQ